MKSLVNLLGLSQLQYDKTDMFLFLGNDSLEYTTSIRMCTYSFVGNSAASKCNMMLTIYPQTKSYTSPTVDPANFKILSHCVVVIDTMFPADFMPEAHVGFDKVMSTVALALAERYR
uniref:Uncharacterized protein n=1 Tax=Monopterus albus TaxID=43700 RepID=A0A3Q3K2D9_MONAL